MGALSFVRNTLTDLTISAENEVVNAYSSRIQCAGSLGALVNFDLLRRFEINLEFLLGSVSSPGHGLRYLPRSGRTLQFERIVPKNIEVLTLTDDKELEWRNRVHYHVVVTAFQSWLGAWETSTPHLRSIRLLLTYDYQEFDSTPTRDVYKLDRTMRLDLDRLSAKAGVEIENKSLIHVLSTPSELLKQITQSWVIGPKETFNIREDVGKELGSSSPHSNQACRTSRGGSPENTTRLNSLDILYDFYIYKHPLSFYFTSFSIGSLKKINSR
ncbi:hypothetical protein BOTNAR_0211g00130 [Botryotinia narcissicola]|uniref:Uncharacterized protein n=1 Tax=Botryotinia narcissicola TaxID=278944 RepID=A0A4Z1IJZ9_9HELO|nr:hypothetical protein BOTNAR_0211g00130 [Botryotinia narcissicola]